MSKVFVDTSAFSKLYIAEAGSREIRALVGDGKGVVVSALIVPELLSAANRLIRERRIDRGTYSLIKTRLLNDLGYINIVAVTPEVLRMAVEVLERSPTRTLDAIQVASARAAEADLFLTSDRQQARAAKAAGLRTRFIRNSSAASAR
jgi:predicted nucleic acid-binding protein